MRRIMHLFSHKNSFLFFSVCLSISFWVLESLLHFHVFDKGRYFVIIPNDPNELWMRIIICLLIIGGGFIADKYIFTLHKIQSEKLRTLKATMYNVHDIAGNALSQISLHCEDDENINQIILVAIKKLNEISDVDEVIEEKNSQGIRNIKVIQPNDRD